MTLASKQNTEALFFESFIERAIKEEQAYIDIVKPILLDAAEYANDRITVYKLGRENLNIKLYLQRWPELKNVIGDNLLLPELLAFIKEDYNEFLNL